MVPRTLLPLLLTAVLLEADSLLTILTGAEPETKAFVFAPATKRFSVATSGTGGIHGQSCIELRSSPEHGNYAMAARSPLLDSFWLTFSFRADTLQPMPADSGGKIPSLQLLALAFHEPTGPLEPHYALGLNLHPVRGGLGPQELEVILRPSKDSTLDKRTRIKVSGGQPHVVELYSRHQAQQITMTFYLDGREAWSTSSGYYLPRRFIGVGLSNQLQPGGRVKVVTDGWRITRQRPHGLPLAPLSGSARVDGSFAQLRAAFSGPVFAGEKITSAAWRLYSSANPSFPLFETRTSDPFMFCSLTVPFELDSGEYRWQVRQGNQHGHFAGWSEPFTFDISATRPGIIRLGRAFVSERPFGPPVGHIVKDRWYRMNLELAQGPMIARSGYFVAVLNCKGHPSGNPANKGGRFLPGGNYPCNFSLYSIPRFSTTLFEKAESSFVSRRLAPGERGLYLDDKGSILDTLTGRVSFSFRLLPQAGTGEWQLTAYVRGSKDTLSNLIRVPLLVEEQQPGSRSPLLPLLGITVLAAALWLAIRTRKKKRSRPPEMAAIESYVQSRIASEISTPQMSHDLKIGINRLQRILKEAGEKSLPALVSRMRVDHAKALMKDPDKSLSDIAFETGFADNSYFTRIFKEFEGVTPTEYRKKTLRQGVS